MLAVDRDVFFVRVHALCMCAHKCRAVHVFLEEARSRCHAGCLLFFTCLCQGDPSHRTGVSEIWLNWLTGKATTSTSHHVFSGTGSAVMCITHELDMCASHLGTGPHGLTASPVPTKLSLQKAVLEREFQCICNKS